MSNVFQDAAEAFGGWAQVIAARTVRIRRGRLLSLQITAWLGMMEHQGLGDDGLATSVLVDGWCFVASEYVIGGETVEPRPGDVITETLNGVAMEYEVLPPTNDQERCWKWRDTSGHLIDVHTKRIS